MFASEGCITIDIDAVEFNEHYIYPLPRGF